MKHKCLKENKQNSKKEIATIIKSINKSNGTIIRLNETNEIMYTIKMQCEITTP